MFRKVALIALIFVLSATQIFAATSTQDNIDNIVKKEVGKLNKGTISIKRYSPTEKVWSMGGFMDRHPEYYFLDYGGIEFKRLPESASQYERSIMVRRTTEGTWPVEGIRFKYLFTNAQITNASPKLYAKVNAIVAKARRENTTRKRVIVVNNELCKIITYNKTTKNCHNTYGAFVEGKAKCDGYSKAFYLCMKRLGIPCEYVSVTAKSGIGHMFNRVTIPETRYKNVKTAYKTTVTKKVGGKKKKVTVTKYKYVKKPYTVKVKYYVDTTWNDSKVRPNRYLLVTKHDGVKRINKIF